MEFKKFSAGSKSYGNKYPDKVNYKPGVTNVNFSDPEFEREWGSGTHQGDRLFDFVNILALCHTIIVEKKNDTIYYNASSPDELALTNAARHFGIIFEDRDEDNNMVIRHESSGTTQKF